MCIRRCICVYFLDKYKYACILFVKGACVYIYIVYVVRTSNNRGSPALIDIDHRSIGDREKGKKGIVAGETNKSNGR